MLHENHCNHPAENFIESHAGCDIFTYTDSVLGQLYCVRHSSEKSDYTSSVPTLDAARRWAEMRTSDV